MTRRAPLVSVVIPAYNAARYVAEAVTSALTQTYERIEVIVVDDGSTDSTASVLEPYFDRIVYRRQSNGGVSVARNNGIAEARGELVAFLDADDLWAPDKIKRQVERLERDVAAGLVHTNKVNLDADTGKRMARAPGAYAWTRSFEGDCYARLLLANGLTTSSVLVKRDCLVAVGGFDERIRSATTEDYDLWLRLARRVPFAFVDESLVIYRLHDTNSSKNTRAMLVNELYVIEKTLAADPELVARVGTIAVSARLGSLWSQLGLLDLTEGHDREARRAMRHVLRHQPSKRALACWLATFLSGGLAHRLHPIEAQ